MLFSWRAKEQWTRRTIPQNNPAVWQKRNFCFLFQHSNRINASRLPPAMAKTTKLSKIFCAVCPLHHFLSLHSCKRLFQLSFSLPVSENIARRAAADSVFAFVQAAFPISVAPSMAAEDYNPVSYSFLLQTTFCLTRDCRRCEIGCCDLGTVSAPTNSRWRAQNSKMRRMMMMLVNT